MALTVTALIAQINAQITGNGAGAITGPILNANLLAMIATLIEPNQVTVTAPGVTAGQPTDGDVLLNAAATQTYNLVASATATRPVCVKDIGGNASAFNKTITPHGAEAIDGANVSIVIASDNGSYSLYPLASGTGWYLK